MTGPRQSRGRQRPAASRASGRWWSLRPSNRNGDRLVWSPKPGIPIEQLLSHLKNVRDVSIEMFLKLPLPLTDMLREWAERWEGEDLATSLALLDATLP